MLTTSTATVVNIRKLTTNRMQMNHINYHSGNIGKLTTKNANEPHPLPQWET
jgi:hypothetical protein